MAISTLGSVPIATTRRRMAALLLSGVAACSEAPPGPGLDGYVADAGSDDAVHVEFDAGPVPPPPPSGCFLSAPIEVHRGTEPATSLSFAAGDEDFLVAYAVAGSEGSHVRVRHLDAARTMHSPLTVTDAPGEYAEIALTATSAGWLLAFTDGQRGVVSRHLSPEALRLDEAPSLEVTLTEAGAGSPTLARTGEEVVFAYRGQLDGVAGAFQRRLGSDGTPTTNASLVVSDDLIDLEVIGGSEGFFAAWSDPAGRVYGRRMTRTSLGPISALNELDPAPTGAFELGFSGATFSTLTGLAELDVRTVRFRHISESGSVSGEPRVLPYRRGEYAEFSVARFAAGFAVAYRHVEAGRNQLRIALMDVDGDELFNTALTGLFNGEGDVVIRQSKDGRIAVLWSDVSLSGDNLLRVADVGCNP